MAKPHILANIADLAAQGEIFEPAVLVERHLDTLRGAILEDVANEFDKRLRKRKRSDETDDEGDEDDATAQDTSHAVSALPVRLTLKRPRLSDRPSWWRRMSTAVGLVFYA